MPKKSKSYSIRPLKGSDFFRISKFLQTANISRIEKIVATKDFAGAVSGASGGAINLSEIARLLVNGITSSLDTICDVEDALPQLLSDLSDLTKDEVMDLPLEDFIDMTIEVFKQPAFVSFYKRIRQLLPKMKVKAVPVPAQEPLALPLQK